MIRSNCLLENLEHVKSAMVYTLALQCATLLLNHAALCCVVYIAPLSGINILE